MTRDPYALLVLRSGRRRIAMRRLARTEPRPLKVPLLNVGTRGCYVLIHRNTGREGGWQATYFDHEGPWGDSRNVDWAKLLEHVHTSGLVPDWRNAERV